MEIILKKDVENLGFSDDVVTVKDGYGRNFLIPQGIGVLATESAKKVLAENLRQLHLIFQQSLLHPQSLLLLCVHVDVSFLPKPSLHSL